jgi:glycosyltransferase involved in cell wall biosynthesis
MMQGHTLREESVKSIGSQKWKTSAVIITLNEEKNIERCLNSIQWMDEIVVIDSGSEDHTLEIAARYTNRIIYREFDNYADQKNFGASQASHDWIFSIDADEMVTAELKDEIEETLSREPPEQMFSLPRINIYFGKRIRYVFGNDSPVRLYNRKKAYFVGAVHEKVSGGTPGKLISHLNHYGPGTYGEWARKHRHYTLLEARKQFRHGRRFSFWRTCLSPFRVFVFRYFILRGWRDGLAGLTVAVEMAFSTFLYHQEILRLSNAINH